MSGQEAAPPPAGTPTDPVPARDHWGTPGATAAESSRSHLRCALATLTELAASGADSVAVAAAIAALRAAAREQETFLHAAAHDLRNPLAAIRGHVQLLERRVRRFPLADEDAARLAASLSAIAAATDRSSDLLEHLFDGAWIADPPEPIDSGPPRP